MTELCTDRLRVYLLGSLEFDQALLLQRRLAFTLREDGRPSLILCEHPPLITVGRQGGPSQIHLTPDELAALRWSVRWVHRGGGTILHVPGQLAIYPVLPLDDMRLSVRDYLDRLQRVLVAVLSDFSVQALVKPDHAGVWVGERLIAAVGVAVRQWVSTFGAVLNIDPDLVLFRHVDSGGSGTMTSLVRERGGQLRTSLVRQKVIEHFSQMFGFAETDVYFQPPGR